MGPLCVKIWKEAMERKGTPESNYAIRALSRSQHFLISEEISAAAFSFSDNMAGKMLSEIPVDFDMPSDSVILENDEQVLFLNQTGEHVYICVLAGVSLETGLSVCYEPGTLVARFSNGASFENFMVSKNLPQEDQNSLITNASWSDIVLNIISTPRLSIVDKPPANFRLRKTKQRLLGTPNVNWKFVSWKVNEPIRFLENNQKGATAQKALHFCRSYWRRSENGKPNAVKRKGPSGEVLPGFWVKVAHSWRGNPAFGIVLHNYTPKIGDEKIDYSKFEAIKEHTTLAADIAASDA